MLKDDLNKNPFRVPEDYFDVLPMTVQQRCIVASKARQARSAIKPQWALATGFGAVALGVASVFSFMNTNSDTVPRIVNNAEYDLSNPYTRLSSKANNYIGNVVKNANSFSITNVGMHSPSLHDRDMGDAIINQLAIENLSIDDILSAGF